MGGEEKRPSPRRWIVLAALLLAVVAFVLPPLVNISRYQHRIADAIGRSIGRPVHISSVRLRLLPLPGFEFSDFSVKEDPHFGRLFGKVSNDCSGGKVSSESANVSW